MGAVRPQRSTCASRACAQGRDGSGASARRSAPCAAWATCSCPRRITRRAVPRLCFKRVTVGRRARSRAYTRAANMDPRDRPAIPRRAERRAARQRDAAAAGARQRERGCVFAKDRDGRYLFVNREFERIAGAPSTRFWAAPTTKSSRPRWPRASATTTCACCTRSAPSSSRRRATSARASRTYLAAKFPLFDAYGQVLCGLRRRDRHQRAQAPRGGAVERGARRVAVGGRGAVPRARALPRDHPRRGCASSSRRATRRRPASMRMRAFHLDGETRENFSYELAGTPCEIVLGNGFQHYPCRLRICSRWTRTSRKLGFEGYAGHPLIDSRGRRLGLLAVVDAPRARAVRRSSSRCCGSSPCASTPELERVAAQQALRASQDELPRDLRGQRGRDLRARLGHRRDPRRQPAGLRARTATAARRFRRLRLGRRSARACRRTPRRRPAPGSSAAKAEGSVRFEWHRAQPRRQPALGRGAPEGGADRRAATGAGVHPRDHRAQASRAGAARERGAVPHGLQRLDRRTVDRGRVAPDRRRE